MIGMAADSSPSSFDAVIARYKQDVDRTLIRENLKRTPEERLRALQELQRLADEAHRQGRRVRKS
jgi:hypothetical protein